MGFLTSAINTEQYLMIVKHLSQLIINYVVLYLRLIICLD